MFIYVEAWSNNKKEKADILWYREREYCRNKGDFMNSKHIASIKTKNAEEIYSYPFINQDDYGLSISIIDRDDNIKSISYIKDEWKANIRNTRMENGYFLYESSNEELCVNKGENVCYIIGENGVRNYISIDQQNIVFDDVHILSGEYMLIRNKIYSIDGMNCIMEWQLPQFKEVKGVHCIFAQAIGNDEYVFFYGQENLFVLLVNVKEKRAVKSLSMSDVRIDDLTYFNGEGFWFVKSDYSKKHIFLN